MKLKPIPRSKATTAYGLVSAVIRVMEQEPKRVHMGVLVDKRSPRAGGPACGTVGCFAGWVSLLKGGPSCADLDRFPSVGHAYGAEEAHARRLLGNCHYHDPAISEHMNGGDTYVFTSRGVDLHGSPGTKTYARSVIARIKRFQHKNAAYLKARKLTRGKDPRR